MSNDNVITTKFFHMVNLSTSMFNLTSFNVDNIINVL